MTVVMAVLVVLAHPAIVGSVSAAETGEFTIDIEHQNGDQADEVNSVIIYQRGEGKLKEVGGPGPGNEVKLKHTFSDLQTGNEYKVRAYIQDQFVGETNWVKISKDTFFTPNNESSVSRTLTAENLVEVTVRAYHADSTTPVANAEMTIESHESGDWREGTTGAEGYAQTPGNDTDFSLYPPSKGNYTIKISNDNEQVSSKQINTLDGDRDIEITTSVSVHELALDTEGSGTVEVSSPDTRTRSLNREYAEGTKIDLTANPDTNHQFAGWEGDIGNVSNDDESIAVRMNKSREVNAIFTKEAYQIQGSSQSVTQSDTLTIVGVDVNSGEKTQLNPGPDPDDPPEIGPSVDTAAPPEGETFRSVQELGPKDKNNISKNGNTDSYPWSAVGRLDDLDDSALCTGVVIHSKYVLTAAHCIYNASTNEWDSGLSPNPDKRDRTANPVFIPGSSGDKDPFGQYDITNVYVYEQWTTSSDPSTGADIALLVLNESIADQTGSFGYSSASKDPTYSSDKLHVTGYPNKADTPFVSTYNQLWDLGADGISKVGQQGIDSQEHTFKTNKGILNNVEEVEDGMSGGPVWQSDSRKEPTILSIISEGNDKETYGAVITNLKTTHISELIQQKTESTPPPRISIAEVTKVPGDKIKITVEIQHASDFPRDFPLRYGFPQITQDDGINQGRVKSVAPGFEFDGKTNIEFDQDGETRVSVKLSDPTQLPDSEFRPIDRLRVSSLRNGPATDTREISLDRPTELPSPELSAPSGMVDSTQEVTLQWSDVESGSDVTYDVYLGTGTDTPRTIVSEDISRTQTAVSVDPGGSYSWKVIAHKDQQRSSSTDGSFSIKSRDIPTDKFSPVQPTNGKQDTGFGVTLKWNAPEPDRDAENYVYLDTDLTPQDGELIHSDRDESTEIDNLDPDTTYYWQVVVENNGKRTAGPVWSFTTAPKTGSLTLSGVRLEEDEELIIDGAAENDHTSRTRLSYYVTADESRSESGGDYDIRVIDQQTGVVLGTDETGTDDEGDRREVELELHDESLFKTPGDRQLKLIAKHHTSGDKVTTTTSVNVNLEPPEDQATILPERPTVDDEVTIDVSEMSEGSQVLFNPDEFEWRVAHEETDEPEIEPGDADEKIEVSFEPDDETEDTFESYRYSLRNTERVTNPYIVDDEFSAVDENTYEPDMQVGDLSVSNDVVEGTPVEASVELTNDGRAKAHYIVRWKVNGQIVDSAADQVIRRDDELIEDTESEQFALRPGNYQITAVVVDARGEKYERTQSVTVTENNPPSLSSPSPGSDESLSDSDQALSWKATDTDGDDLTYTVRLDAGDSTPDKRVATKLEKKSFDPGMLTEGTTYYWQVTATDEHGRTETGPVWSFSTSSNKPDVPEADAGKDRTVTAGNIVKLDATGSSSPNGDALTYQFQQVPQADIGPAPDVSLQEPKTRTPEFTAPDVTSKTTLRFELTVTDSAGTTDTDQVSVTITPGAKIDEPAAVWTVPMEYSNTQMRTGDVDSDNEAELAVGNHASYGPSEFGVIEQGQWVWNRSSSAAVHAETVGAVDDNRNTEFIFKSKVSSTWVRPYGTDTSPLWSVNHRGWPDSASAVDTDNDGGTEVAAMSHNNGYLTVIDDNGDVLWRTQSPANIEKLFGLTEVTGDDTPEILTHSPPNDDKQGLQLITKGDTGGVEVVWRAEPNAPVRATLSQLNSDADASEEEKRVIAAYPDRGLITSIDAQTGDTQWREEVASAERVRLTDVSGDETPEVLLWSDTTLRVFSADSRSLVEVTTSTPILRATGTGDGTLLLVTEDALISRTAAEELTSIQIDGTQVNEMSVGDTDGDDNPEIALGIGRSLRLYDNLEMASSPLEFTSVTADAGEKQTVTAGETVTLDGTGSIAPENSALSYQFQQVSQTDTETGSAPGVSLRDSDTRTPEFIAPEIDSETTLAFELTVADSAGTTDTDRVSVTITPDEPAPPASLTFTDQSVPSGSSIISIDTAQFGNQTVPGERFVVVIHRTGEGTYGDGIGPKVGESDVLTPGTQQSVEVDLSQTLAPSDDIAELTESRSLVAMLHRADTTDGDGVNHGAQITRDGDKVTSRARLTVSSSSALRTHRSLTSTEVTNGSTVTVTVTANFESPTGDAKLVDTISGGGISAENLTITDAAGAAFPVVTLEPTPTVDITWNGTLGTVSEDASSTVEYELTIPEDTPVGTTIRFDGTVTNSNSGETVVTGGDTQLTVVADATSTPDTVTVGGQTVPTEFTTETSSGERTVTADNAVEAINAFIQDETSADVAVDVINGFIGT